MTTDQAERILRAIYGADLPASEQDLMAEMFIPAQLEPASGDQGIEGADQ